LNARGAASIVGNSRLLVAIGPRAELAAFYYPHLDFSQHIGDSALAVRFGAGPAVWTDDPSWTVVQQYVTHRNILVSRLIHAGTGLVVEITDLVHPARSVLTRIFEFQNDSKQRIEGTAYQYLHLSIGEHRDRNTLHRTSDGSLVQCWRNRALAWGGDAFDAVHFGCLGEADSARTAIERGALTTTDPCTGDVDSAVAWDLAVDPGGRFRRVLYLGAESDALLARDRVARAIERGHEWLERVTNSHWEVWCAKLRYPRVDAGLQELYLRSLLSLRLLLDEERGCLVAPAEPGGYPVCGVRDLVEAAGAMGAAGLRDLAGRIFQWALKVQAEGGFWEADYWSTGERGPSAEDWAEMPRVKPTAWVLYGMHRYWSRLSELDQLGFVEASWRGINDAAEFLIASLDERSLHLPTRDIWGTETGTWALSNACLVGAFQAVAGFADFVGESTLSAGCEALSRRVRGAVFEHLWDGSHYSRGLIGERALHATPDCDILGLAVPFRVLDLADDAQRARFEATIQWVESAIRNQDDSAGLCVNTPRPLIATLWLARANLRLAASYTIMRPDQARLARARAVEYLRAVQAAASPTGLLFEEHISGSEFPSLWGLAWLVRAVNELEELDAALNH